MVREYMFKVFRFDPDNNCGRYFHYAVESEEKITVLKALRLIYETAEEPPAYRRYFCNRGQCFSCVMSINGRNARACTTIVQDGIMVLEPAAGFPIIKDLVVDFGAKMRNRDTSYYLFPRGKLIQLPASKAGMDSQPTPRINIDKEECIGCEACIDVCPMNRIDTLERISGEKIHAVTFLESDTLNLSYICRQCIPALCIEACPIRAIRRGDTGVIINTDDCTGCGICALACPWNSIFMDMAQGKAFKCELCGGEPKCVKSCPTEALSYRGGKK